MDQLSFSGSSFLIVYGSVAAALLAIVVIARWLLRRRRLASLDFTGANAQELAYLARGPVASPSHPDELAALDARLVGFGLLAPLGPYRWVRALSRWPLLLLAASGAAAMPFADLSKGSAAGGVLAVVATGVAAVSLWRLGRRTAAGDALLRRARREHGELLREAGRAPDTMSFDQGVLAAALTGVGGGADGFHETSGAGHGHRDGDGDGGGGHHGHEHHGHHGHDHGGYDAGHGDAGGDGGGGDGGGGD